MLTKEKAEKRIAELQSEIVELQKITNPTTSHQLAEWLHWATPHTCDVDRCGWSWELDWNGYSHQNYLQKAEELINYAKEKSLDIEVVRKIILIVHGHSGDL